MFVPIRLLKSMTENKIGMQIPSSHRRDGRVTTDLEIAPRVIGFSNPPLPVSVALTRKRSHWLLDVRGPPGSHVVLTRWLKTFYPSGVEHDRRGVHAKFDRAQPEWESLAAHFDVLDFDLGADGMARVSVRARPEHIQALLTAHEERRPFILDEYAPIMRPRLTRRQRFVLHTCFEAGYYDVPRKTSLGKIAKRLGIGLNSLSVVLRNAEAAMIRAFIQSDEKPKDGNAVRGRGNDGTGD